LKKRLAEIRDKEEKLIVGIETGNTTGRLGAVVVGVSGRGDLTLLDLYAYQKHELPSEMTATLELLEGDGDLDSEEVAGINFLVLHQVTSLFQELFDEIDLRPEDIDMIGLKCMEVGKSCFPEDPAVLSEMTGCIVASHFRIELENGEGPTLAIAEPLLRGLVDEMVERFDLDSDAREAVAVALLANEAVHHGYPGGKSKKTGLTVGDDEAGLYGEFYFPTS
jgi:1,6-anhydro-N-acetylmuramate kinase